MIQSYLTWLLKCFQSYIQALYTNEQAKFYEKDIVLTKFCIGRPITFSFFFSFFGYVYYGNEHSGNIRFQGTRHVWALFAR